MGGATVLNRFEIGERLGAGGHGTVYRAWDRRLERDVAVKVVETVPASGPRIQREAQAAARLNHPGIVALYEFVHHEYGADGGRAYLVSELVDGETVREMYDRDILSDRQIAELGADVCEALDHAHDRGVIHRDIKPANLIVPFAGHGTKLMDFGIARLVESDDLTATGDVLGTLAYMPPEQARGEPVGPPGDLYSLALTLYEGWTGRNPRRRPTPAETLRTLDLPPPELATMRPDLPAALTDLIDACLDPEPRYRPRIEELGSGLEAALPDLSRVAPGIDHRSAPRSPVRPIRLVPALVIATFPAVCMIASGRGEPVSVALSFVLVAIAATASARLGFLLAATGTTAWLAIEGLPGAAFALGLIAIAPGLTVRGDARHLASIATGPLLGLAGLAPAAALLAALAEEWRDRAVIAIAALGATALTAVASGRATLLPGDLPQASAGWAESISGAVTGLIGPTLASPAFLLALPAWVLIATIAGVLIERYRRSRASRRSVDHGFAGVGSGTITRIDPFENELLP